MFIAAIIIYLVLGLLLGPTWPLDFLGGKAGPLGYIIFFGWLALFIAGINS